MNAPLWLKLKISLKGLVATFVRPLRILAALTIAFLVVSFFVWLPNLELLYMLGKLPALSYWDKISVFFEGLGGLFTNFMEVQAVSILIVALLVGINTVLLISVGSRLVGHAKSGGATVLAVFAAGCAACGTSIIAPAIASLAAATSIGFVEVLGLIANLLAIGLLGYSIYKLGLQAASLEAQKSI